MTNKELVEIFSNLEDKDDRNNLINSYIRWWNYGYRQSEIDDFDNTWINFDIVSFGVAVVRKIIVLDSPKRNYRLEVKVLPYELFIKGYIVKTTLFLKMFQKFTYLDQVLSQLKRYGKELTYPDFFKKQSDLLEG